MDGSSATALNPNPKILTVGCIPAYIFCLAHHRIEATATHQVCTLCSVTETNAIFTARRFSNEIVCKVWEEEQASIKRRLFGGQNLV